MQNPFAKGIEKCDLAQKKRMEGQSPSLAAAPIFDPFSLSSTSPELGGLRGSGLSSFSPIPRSFSSVGGSEKPPPSLLEFSKSMRLSELAKSQRDLLPLSPVLTRAKSLSLEAMLDRASGDGRSSRTLCHEDNAIRPTLPPTEQAPVQPTLASIPKDPKLLSQLSLPLELSVQPFVSGDSLPVIDGIESVIPRCEKCMTFFNPYMTVSKSSFTCNVCHVVSPLNAVSGHSQITTSSYDIEVTEDHYLTHPLDPVHVFVLENSQYTREHGIFEQVLNQVQLLAVDFIVIVVDRYIHFIRHVPGNGLSEVQTPVDLDGFSPIPLGQLIMNHSNQNFSDYFQFIRTLKPYLDSFIPAAILASIDLSLEEATWIHVFCGPFDLETVDPTPDNTTASSSVSSVSSDGEEEEGEMESKSSEENQGVEEPIAPKPRSEIRKSKKLKKTHSKVAIPSQNSHSLRKRGSFLDAQAAVAAAAPPPPPSLLSEPSSSESTSSRYQGIPKVVPADSNDADSGDFADSPSEIEGEVAKQEDDSQVEEIFNNYLEDLKISGSRIDLYFFTHGLEHSLLEQYSLLSDACGGKIYVYFGRNISQFEYDLRESLTSFHSFNNYSYISLDPVLSVVEATGPGLNEDDHFFSNVLHHDMAFQFVLEMKKKTDRSILYGQISVLHTLPGKSNCFYRIHNFSILCVDKKQMYQVYEDANEGSMVKSFMLQTLAAVSTGGNAKVFSIDSIVVSLLKAYQYSCDSRIHTIQPIPFSLPPSLSTLLYYVLCIRNFFVFIDQSPSIKHQLCFLLLILSPCLIRVGIDCILGSSPFSQLILNPTSLELAGCILFFNKLYCIALFNDVRPELARSVVTHLKDLSLPLPPADAESRTIARLRDVLNYLGNPSVVISERHCPDARFYANQFMIEEELKEDLFLSYPSFLQFLKEKVEKV